MSYDDLISGIPTQLDFAEIPDSFSGTVIKIEKTAKKNGEYKGQPQLTITIQIENLETPFVTTYRIPKAMTGRGQMDKLLKALKTLKIPKISEMQGKKFKWVKAEIEMGNPRHYPTELID